MHTTVIRIAAVAALALAPVVAAPAFAQQGLQVQEVDTPQRRAMQQCVARVLDRLVKAKATYQQVTPTVAQQCDAQLRAVLAAEIQAGRAAGCTVESCIEMARGHAGQRAVNEFNRLSIQ